MLTKTLSKKLIGGLAASVAVLLPFLLAPTALAASASMYLTYSGSTSNGGTLSVSIRENSGGEPVNTASATISYPTNLLSYKSVGNSSAFGISAATSGGGGSVHVDRGALPAVSGSQTIAIVYFRVLASSGKATVNITSGQVLSANTNANIASGFSGTTVTLTAPPAATPAAPAAPADTTPPTISAVKAEDITFNSVTITWTTSEPANSEVDYGLNTNYGLSAADGSLVTSHKLVLNSALITPATNYHYKVKSADAAGNTASGSDASFKTAGGTITLTLVDQNNKPLADAKVSLLDSSATTDKNGKATVTGIQPGKQSLVVLYRGKTYSQTVTIPALDAAGQAKPAKYSVKVSPSNWWLPLVIVVLVLAAIAWWLRRGGGLPPALRNRFGKPAKSVTSPGITTGPSAAAESNPHTEPKVVKPIDTTAK